MPSTSEQEEGSLWYSVNEYGCHLYNASVTPRQYVGHIPREEWLTFAATLIQEHEKGKRRNVLIPCT